MMICGVENVYPREVEEFLYRTPDVDGVEVITDELPMRSPARAGRFKMHARSLAQGARGRATARRPRR
jgi:acyl-CoA synthetase (AMP-forming)/AMP-acid ligase II